MKWFERLLVQLLRRRGWIVFWLDKPARHCSKDVCWLNLYESECNKS